MLEPSILSAILNSPSPTASKSENDLIAVASCTVEDLFNVHLKPLPGTAITGRICIPEYQRSYVWKERQINKLLNDLFEHAKDPDKRKPLITWVALYYIMMAIV